MPLDTGAFVDGPRPEAEQIKRPRISLDATVGIGAALAAARRTLGLSLDEISETTRVRVRHLEALEADRIEQLPSRPFTVGYVRAYAKALGLDADAVASRFRTEHPSPDDFELRTPVGVRHEPKRSYNGLIAAVAGLAAVAVIGWNVVQHVTSAPTPRAVAVTPSHAAALAQANTAVGGPFALQAPLPAPPEATAPAPYITPVAGTDTNAIAAATAPAAGGAFAPQGHVYSSVGAPSPLIIQARKSISLEVRGPGGVVYFARELAAGEAYRVPALPNLTAEVSNPASAELFDHGVSKGVFTAPQMPLKTEG
ncbi:MAG TPA: helix-turn-helix transcriptional regulator [Caulobacteraceae bacterium]|jgi:cytoskeletal protein RodZ|nr:helix-turn-helix transcriptional regulator [Caulobacteraceae bacterium]